MQPLCVCMRMRIWTATVFQTELHPAKGSPLPGWMEATEK